IVQQERQGLLAFTPVLEKVVCEHRVAFRPEATRSVRPGLLPCRRPLQSCVQHGRILGAENAQRLERLTDARPLFDRSSCYEIECSKQALSRQPGAQIEALGPICLNRELTILPSLRAIRGVSPQSEDR